MKKIITLFAFVAVVLLFIVFVSYTISNNETTGAIDEVSKEVVEEVVEEVVIPEPAEGGTLKVAINDPASLNPLVNKDESIDLLLQLVFDGLVSLDQNQKPQVNLANSVEASVNGTYLTVTLKPEVYWHDGEVFTADDVVFTIETLKALGGESMYAKSIENISYANVIDDNTVEIVLKQAYSGYLYGLTFPIIPEHIYQGEDMLTTEKNMTPIGTGSYIFEAYTPMQDVSLTKNNNWHGGYVYINNVSAIITRDEAAKINSLEANITNALYTSQVDWSKFTSNENWQVNEFSTYYYDFVGFNFNHALLQDKDLRQALVYSVNREEIVNEYLMGFGTVTETPIHPDSWLNTSELAVYAYNINKASEILLKEGWADSDNDGILEKGNDKLSLEMIVSNSDPARLAIANAIKEDLAEVGIEVIITPLDSAAFYARIEADDFDLFYGGWNLSPIVDLTFAFGTNATGNYINYSSATMDELLANAFKAMDEITMKNEYAALIEYIQSEVPYMSLFFRENALVTSDIYGEIEPSPNNIYDSIENWYIAE
ncbi:peptide ABC transporter substrate-binding protein [Vallitalea okinawensis]|uniref:peptide ABC transporter substrate-binding protein n=1 Tax=Vallitalea okinawensis TaxID=2078660 RepID=UPI000CFC99B3|nr:peptide ABC transporter substrate-binding protein [Vallitalea okinawensis]